MNTILVKELSVSKYEWKEIRFIEREQKKVF